MVYLDHSATTKVRPEVIALMSEVLAATGNPSSIHAAGRAARKYVEVAREQVAKAVNSYVGEVVFTAGGTEADNLAIKGIYQYQVAADPARTKLAIFTLEHPAVKQSAQYLETQGAEVVWLPATTSGVIDLVAAKKLISENAAELALISVMWVNNELGTVQPIAELAALANELQIPFHTDAVQAGAYVDIDFRGLGISALSLSAHKLGGPQGVGALILERKFELEPQLHGGAQERKVRSGTIPAAQIAGFGLAMELAVSHRSEMTARLNDLRSQFEAWMVSTHGARINAVDEPRIPTVASVTMPGVNGEDLLIALDNLDVQVSAGSACSAGVSRPSAVLKAIGFSDEETKSTLRMSFGWPDDAAVLSHVFTAFDKALRPYRK